MSETHHTRELSFSARAALPSCSPLSCYLLNLMTIKRTNLCISADVTTSHELLQIAEELGDTICVIKTHSDIITDFSDRTWSQLTEIARRKYFLIFEDRKFADIGSTVQKQYTNGPLSIAKWAELVTTHLFPGPAIITALEMAANDTILKYNTTVHTEISAGGHQSEGNREFPDFEHVAEPEDSDVEHDGKREPKEHWRRKHSIVSISTTISTRSEPMSPQPVSQIFRTTSEAESIEQALNRLGPIPYLRATLVLAQMSSKDNFFTPEYTQKCVNVSRDRRDFVMGFISQTSLNSQPNDNFLIFTPGVKLLDPESSDRGDGLGQQYRSPSQVIQEDGTDVIIVGRGIIAAENRLEVAEKYRKAAWDAYESRIK